VELDSSREDIAANGRVRIDLEFAALIPPLSGAERAGLEAGLRRDGSLAPLLVWGEKGILLDGHHRLDICRTARSRKKQMFRLTVRQLDVLMEQ
jgi:hypothetical protein